MDKPKTIDEAMQALKETLTLDDQATILKMERPELVRLHHGLGRWIRNNFGLWEKDAVEGTLLAQMLQLGFIHPDDMSQALIVEYWNRMNNQPSEMQKQIESYKKYWDDLDQQMTEIKK